MNDFDSIIETNVSFFIQRICDAPFGLHNKHQPLVRKNPISFYENLQIPIPTISEQNEIVKEIEGYEIKIAEAKKIIENSAEQKHKILEKYLN